MRTRILVIDDNVDAASTLAMLLKMLNYEVREAFDGQRGVQLAQEFRPHVIVSDIGMPGMTGYDVARAVRRSCDTHRTILIACTGYASTVDSRRSFEAGFNAHLAKPVDLEHLQRLLPPPEL